MSEVVYERIKKNLEILNMKNTSLILDNYLEKAIHDKKNIVEVLDYLLAEEAKTKKNRAVENQIKMSGFPYRKTLEQFDFDFQPELFNCLFCNLNGEIAVSCNKVESINISLLCILKHPECIGNNAQ